MKCNNIGTIGMPEGEEKEQGIETLFEKITENFLNLETEKATQVQEAQQVPIKMNPKRPTPRPNFKDKGRILKATREKQEVTYKGTLISLVADFSTDILQARREWQKIFQVLKSKGLQPRLL